MTSPLASWLVTTLVLLAGCTLLNGNGPDIVDTSVSVFHGDENTLRFTASAGERGDFGWARYETFDGHLDVDVVYGKWLEQPSEREFDYPDRTFSWVIRAEDFDITDWGEKGVELFGTEVTRWWSKDTGWYMTRCFDYGYNDVYHVRATLTVDHWGKETHYDSDYRWDC